MRSSSFTFSGIVQRNLGRGRQLGYPTANIHISPNIPDGLFVGYTKIDDRSLPSLVFIGPNVTFGETDKKAEVFILDFNEDIYGKEIQVEALKKLRDGIKFTTLDALIAQMKQDELEARKFF
ncbi:riboflavin kinase [Candidatus Woesebacteria bacterium]|nr:riboflavin kinase [Candidatus Woesebacteria bacterium]